MTNQTVTRKPLHRKYRPKKFENFVGNSDVVQRLTKIVEQRNIPNALLFTGDSGLGKTTLMRILARQLSCETTSGCGQCPSCKAFDSNSHPDYTELNASESRGIDDVRQILQQVRLSPLLSPLRFFVLDECFDASTQVCVSLDPLEYKPINEIATGQNLPAMDVNTMSVVTSTVTDSGQSWVPESCMLTVELEDGTEVTCTDNHQWWSVTRGRMVRADELEPDEELLVLA